MHDDGGRLCTPVLGALQAWGGLHSVIRRQPADPVALLNQQCGGPVTNCCEAPSPARHIGASARRDRQPDDQAGAGGPSFSQQS